MQIALQTVVVAAVILGAGTAHAQVQTVDQQKCIRAMNKDGAKLSGAQAKLQAGCVKAMSAGGGDADACVTADEKFAVAKAAAKTTTDDGAICAGNAPDFGYTGAATVNPAATVQRHSLLVDLLGTPVAPAVVLKSTSSDLAACQGKVLKALDKLMSTKLKVFNACKKSSLATAASALTLETDCFAAIAASAVDGTVAKGILKAGADRAKFCPDADLDTTFPGVCSASVGAAFDSCAEARVECRTCLMLNQMDGLSMDCDLFDDGATNDSCELEVGCIYVSASQGTAMGDGTPADPIDSISNGILAALIQEAPAVCVSGELYAEQVTMESGVSILGGYDHTQPGFPFSLGANTAIGAGGTVFLASSIDALTTIANVSIHATTPVVPGESTYGVRLLGGIGELLIRDSVINVEKGANGSAGADGTAPVVPTAPGGANGENGCDGCSGFGTGGPAPTCAEPGGKGGKGGYDTGSGEVGSMGTGGAMGGTAGGAGFTCFDEADAGGTGGSVSGGSQGSPGAAGGSLGSAAGGFYVPSDGGNGSAGAPGKGGSGGGGGGGGISNFACNGDRGGGGGAGGCGGGGGNFGRGGGGAGGTFGVFAAGGTVSVQNTAITTASGATGGAGGDGASGQTGGSGGSGGTGPDDGGPGGLGGPGSDGGAGGAGSGGGGGPVACIARTASATSSATGLSCLTGSAGAGGAAGTNPQGGVGSPGQTGSSGVTLVVN